MHEESNGGNKHRVPCATIPKNITCECLEALLRVPDMETVLILNFASLLSFRAPFPSLSSSFSHREALCSFPKPLIRFAVVLSYLFFSQRFSLFYRDLIFVWSQQKGQILGSEEVEKKMKVVRKKNGRYTILFRDTTRNRNERTSRSLPFFLPSNFFPSYFLHPHFFLPFFSSIHSDISMIHNS